MLRSIVMTCRMHTCDVFDEMFVMANMGLVTYFFNYCHLYHCFDVTLHF